MLLQELGQQREELLREMKHLETELTCKTQFCVCIMILLYVCDPILTHYTVHNTCECFVSTVSVSVQ